MSVAEFFMMIRLGQVWNMNSAFERKRCTPSQLSIAEKKRYSLCRIYGNINSQAQMSYFHCRLLKNWWIKMVFCVNEKTQMKQWSSRRELLLFLGHNQTKEDRARWSFCTNTRSCTTHKLIEVKGSLGIKHVHEKATHTHMHAHIPVYPISMSDWLR